MNKLNLFLGCFVKSEPDDFDGVMGVQANFNHPYYGKYQYLL